jgi:hypothetical protein
MALAHSPGLIEVACNLLDPWASPPQVGALTFAACTDMPLFSGCFALQAVVPRLLTLTPPAPPPSTRRPQVVQAAIQAAAEREGLQLQAGGAYVIGKLPGDIAAAAAAAGC